MQAQTVNSNFNNLASSVLQAELKKRRIRALIKVSLSIAALLTVKYLNILDLNDSFPVLMGATIGYISSTGIFETHAAHIYHFEIKDGSLYLYFSTPIFGKTKETKFSVSNIDKVQYSKKSFWHKDDKMTLFAGYRKIEGYFFNREKGLELCKLLKTRNHHPLTQ